MNILAPLDKIKEIEALIEAGATELFCGFNPGIWKANYSKYSSTNRREWSQCNLSSIDELKLAVRRAHYSKTKIYLVANSSFYAQQQMKLLFNIIKSATKTGIDGIIVGDIALIREIHSKIPNLQMHLSVGSSVLNSYSVRFYKKLGISRIILPRHLTISEIKEIVQNSPDLEFEAIVFNDGCSNLDGFCNTLHGIGKFEERQLYCTVPATITVETQPPFKATPRQIRTVRSRFAHRNDYLSITCGTCALYDFNKIGLNSVKIAGRGEKTKKKVRTIAFIKKIINELPHTKNKELFKKKASALFQETFKQSCSFGKCYYPI